MSGARGGCGRGGDTDGSERGRSLQTQGREEGGWVMNERERNDDSERRMGWVS